MAAVTQLETRGLTRRFGGMTAVDNVDFILQRGGIHALIGPNGAGKSTFVGLVSGRIPASAGTVHFEGRDVSRLPAHRRIRLGMAYTFPITSAFSAGKSVSSAFTIAAAFLRIAKARITSIGIFCPPILKFCQDRWVCAPQYLSAGTRISPMVSFSIRYSI